MDKFIKIVKGLVFLITILLVLKSVFVSRFSVNDGYNLAATLYLGKVSWVVLIVALIMGVLKREFFARSVTDLMVLAFALMLYLHSGSLELYKEQTILLLSIYFTFRQLTHIERWAKYIVPVALVGAVAAQLYIAYSQLFANGVSNHALFAFTGSFENPGPMCGFVAMLLPITLYFAFKVDSFPVFENRVLNVILSILKYCFAAVAIAGAALVIAGGSRTALVALIIGAMLLYISSNGVDQIKRLLFAKKGVVIAVATVLIVAVVGGGYLLFMAKADSAFGRLLLWRTSLSVIAENSFWGVGLGKFTSCYGDAQAAILSGMEPTDMWVRVADVPQYAFNEYLHFGVEGGVLAMLLLIGIFFYTIFRLFKCGSPLGNVYGVSLVVLAIFAFASYPFHVLPFTVVATILLAASVSEFEKGVGVNYDKLICGLALLFCTINIWRNPHYSDKALREWSSERRYYNMDIFKTTVDNYGKLLPTFSDNYAFLFEYGRALSQTNQYQLSDSILTLGTRYSKDPMFFNLLGKNAVARSNFNSAEHYIKQSLTLLPNRHYPLYLLFDMYLQKGDTVSARYWGERFLNQPPKVNSKFIQEKQTEVRERLRY